MISLYTDQTVTVANARAAITKSKSVLLVSPTGSGKTRMAASIVTSAVAKGNVVGFTVPRIDLMNQTSKTFEELGIAHSFIAAGRKTDSDARVFIGMVDTMARRLDKLPPINLLIPDETRFGAKALGSVIDYHKALGSWILGLDASPWKASGKGLGCWYDTMVLGRSVRWLIDNNRLSDYRYFGGRRAVDLSNVPVERGQYAKVPLAEYMENRGDIIGDCVADYIEKCWGNIHAVRCSSIKHSQEVAQAFRDAGIAAAHVDGKTTVAERNEIYRKLALREIWVVTFCSLLEFGFDLSQATGLEVCIESGSDLKPCKSLASQVQWWGRLLRYAKGKVAVIIDHVNNWLEHGFPCDERAWTLEDREQGTKAATERATPIRQCKACFACFRPAAACPYCGAVSAVISKELKHIAGVTTELSKADREQIKADKLAAEEAERMRKKKEEWACVTVQDYYKLGKARAYKHPMAWAKRKAATRKPKGLSVSLRVGNMELPL